jgi:hypothetical protein
VDDFVLLDELNGILRGGTHDLNEAAKRLGLPLSVVQGAFEDGLLKGYWKVLTVSCSYLLTRNGYVHALKLPEL